MTRAWRPLGTRETRDRPRPGALIAHEHAVWRVLGVHDVEFDDDDRRRWTQAGLPDPATWCRRPYQLSAEHVGGAVPAKPTTTYGMVIRAEVAHLVQWNVYRSDRRWPQCSVCGEPVPCREELEEAEIGAVLDTVAQLMAKAPGNCWSCDRRIGGAAFVEYVGDNLELPGGHPPRFHRRRGDCVYQAEVYERKWLAVDPRRERILTWPECDGLLVVHADGTSECHGSDDGESDQVAAPDCQGHLTHDHGPRTTCTAFGRPGSATGTDSCPRGCSSHGHPGTATPPRPPRTARGTQERTDL